MRDAADARKFFVESDKVNDFRDVIIAEQIRLLLSEYDQLILDEVRRSPHEARASGDEGAGSRDFSERPGPAVKLWPRRCRNGSDVRRTASMTLTRYAFTSRSTSPASFCTA